MTKISVVIPIYNQYNSLGYVLHSFAAQQLDKNMFEIIIIDDGSTDELATMNSKVLQNSYNINIELIHQKNSGRATSRNNGVRISAGDIIVFCDGDRVPNQDYLSQYLHEHQTKDVIVGGSLDYFGKPVDFLNFDDSYIRKLSRFPIYYKNTRFLFDSDGQSNSKFSWLGFLTGNASVKKDLFNEVGGFSLEFTDWGFEHFELAYRFVKRNINIFLNENIHSYHIPHPRLKGFYEEKIEKSINLIVQMHPDIKKDILMKIFLDNDYKYKFDKLKELLK